MGESSAQFEKRKKDHIQVALNPLNQAHNGAGFERIQLIHEALPEINFTDVSIETKIWNHQVKPLFISSMTAGHVEGALLNQRLATASQKLGWIMGVGSQRRQLQDKAARDEWDNIRKHAPSAVLVSNIGIAQAITSSPDEIKELISSLNASALFIHTNPVQEALQLEGTPLFKGGIKAIAKLCESLSVPVILKETGCGFSVSTLRNLVGLGLYAVDVSGFGGTHWGRIEGDRAPKDHPHQSAADTFANWGISTIDSLLNAISVEPDYKYWASGGIRSGLDAAKCLALGAENAGVAQPLLVAALRSEQEVLTLMEQFELTLKMALFFTGSRNIEELRKFDKFKVSV